MSEAPFSRTSADGQHPDIRTVHSDAWSTRLALSGEFDLAVAATLRAELSAQLREHRVLHLDLHGVGFLDCSALGALVATQLRTRAVTGSLLILHNLSRPARRLLQLSGLEKVLLVDHAPHEPDARG